MIEFYTKDMTGAWVNPNIFLRMVVGAVRKLLVTK